MALSMKLAICGLFLGLISATSGQNGWQNVGGRYLKFNSEPKTFAEADAICAGFGGVIAYDDHPAVHAFLGKSGKLQWIGATDAGHEGKWTWSNGGGISAAKWHPGEPNNVGGNQNCAVINWRQFGLWDDQGCELKHPFHCQVQKPGFAYAVSRSAFKIHKEKKSWADAVKTCRAEGAQLVVDDNKQINDWLAKLHKTVGTMWIGATDEGHEGTYNWATGKTVPSQFWYPGEPNNVGGHQNCAVVNFVHPGKWDDQHCNTKLPFVCQVSW